MSRARWFRADGPPIAFDGVFINTDEKHETNERLHRALEEAEKARNELLLIFCWRKITN